jgi:predicted rRNA methylase YqxC with S4 and FtsJ domains
MKTRLDQLLVARGLAQSRAQAQVFFQGLRLHFFGSK